MLHRSAFHLVKLCVDRRSGVGQGPETEIFSPSGGDSLGQFLRNFYSLENPHTTMTFQVLCNLSIGVSV